MGATVHMQWKDLLKTKGPVPCPRRGHTMTQLINSSTYVLYAGESAADELLNDMYTFDVSTKQWNEIQFQQGQPCPSPRYRHTTTAITKTHFVVIGGETRDETSPTSPQQSQKNNYIDVWLFDLNSNSWAQITSASKNRDVNDIPSSRGGHSSLYIKIPGQPPGIYLFGGFGSNNFSSIVYRLKTQDWKWERINVISKSIISNQVISIPDPHEYRQEETDAINFSPNSKKRFSIVNCPCPRESHVAIWISYLSGMLIFGGESDDNFHQDFWLLHQSTTTQFKTSWQWKQLKISMSGNFTQNCIPPLSAASGLLLSEIRPQLIIWAGITSSTELNLLRFAWIVDMKSLKSVRINVIDLKEDTGRVMHTVVKWNNKILLCGGVDADSDMGCQLQVVEFPNSLTNSCCQARNFGPLANRIAEFGGSLKGDVEHDDERSRRKKNGVVNNFVSNGMEFTGKVLWNSEFGTHVAINVHGKVHKGLLIAYPEKEIGDGNIISNGNNDTNNKSNISRIENGKKVVAPAVGTTKNFPVVARPAIVNVSDSTNGDASTRKIVNNERAVDGDGDGDGDGDRDFNMRKDKKNQIYNGNVRRKVGVSNGTGVEGVGTMASTSPSETGAKVITSESPADPIPNVSSTATPVQQNRNKNIQTQSQQVTVQDQHAPPRNGETRNLNKLMASEQNSEGKRPFNSNGFNDNDNRQPIANASGIIRPQTEAACAIAHSKVAYRDKEAEGKEQLTPMQLGKKQRIEAIQKELMDADAVEQQVEAMKPPTPRIIVNEVITLDDD